MKIDGSLLMNVSIVKLYTFRRENGYRMSEVITVTVWSSIGCCPVGVWTDDCFLSGSAHEAVADAYDGSPLTTAVVADEIKTAAAGPRTSLFAAARFSRQTTSLNVELRLFFYRVDGELTLSTHIKAY